MGFPVLGTRQITMLVVCPSGSRRKFQCWTLPVHSPHKLRGGVRGSFVSSWIGNRQFERMSAVRQVREFYCPNTRDKRIAATVCYPVQFTSKDRARFIAGKLKSGVCQRCSSPPRDSPRANETDWCSGVYFPVKFKRPRTRFTRVCIISCSVYHLDDHTVQSVFQSWKDQSD